MSKGRDKQRRSPKLIGAAWVGVLLSAGLLYVAAAAVVSDLKTFRSCNANNAGLSIVNCGKQGLNVGDFILFGLFVLAAAMLVSLFTAAWRLTLREKS